jgi:hypothetical protein
LRLPRFGGATYAVDFDNRSRYCLPSHGRSTWQSLSNGGIFTATLCGAAAWPLVVHAQQADRIYRLGFLGVAPGATRAPLMKAFREGLATLGYIEGRNIVIEERRLEVYNKHQVAELAAQLVGTGQMRRLPQYTAAGQFPLCLCLSEIKHAHTDDGVRQEMA